MKKSILPLLLILLLAASLLAPCAAESFDANTMRLLRHAGDVEIFDPEGASRFIMENVRFASGESMKTGAASAASVGLDDAKIVTLDQSTQVAFIQEAGHLQLNLTEGAIFVDVQEKLDEIVSKGLAKIDYIHGEASLRALAARDRSLGLLMPVFGKSELFSSVISWASERLSQIYTSNSRLSLTSDMIISESLPGTISFSRS